MCPHCGYGHVGTCPKIKAIEYHPDGTVKRIEFHPVQPLVQPIDDPVRIIGPGHIGTSPTYRGAMGAQERIEQIRPIVEKEMASPENVADFEAHPLPWRWFVTYHDGPCIGFLDANGRPCLPGFIYDPEVAATVLSAINNGR